MRLCRNNALVLQPSDVVFADDSQVSLTADRDEQWIASSLINRSTETATRGWHLSATFTTKHTAFPAATQIAS